MKKRIHTLEQLKAAKRKLQIEKEASKQLFFDSLGNTRRTATSFLTNKVLLPAGITGVAAWGASKLLSDDDEQKNIPKNHRYRAIATQFSNPNSQAYKLIKQFLPLATKLLMAYIGKKTMEEVSNNEPTTIIKAAHTPEHA